MRQKPAISRAEPLKAVPARMDRDHMRGIPGFPLPAGYAIVPYRQGDEVAWTDIHREADRFNSFDGETFRRQFGTSPRLLRLRQCYLLAPDRHAVGTVSAWFDGARGRIHWLAIRPAFQGLGLAKPLLETACQRLAALGHRRAYLTTATNRVEAIDLYARFGFRPVIRSELEREAWDALLGHLRTPSARAVVRAALET